jgi:hypothetical protein
MKNSIRTVLIAASLCLVSAPMFAASAPGGTNPHPQSLIDLFMSLLGL